MMTMSYIDGGCCLYCSIEAGLRVPHTIIYPPQPAKPPGTAAAAESAAKTSCMQPYNPSTTEQISLKIKFPRPPS